MMTAESQLSIVYDTAVKGHIRNVDAKYHSLIRKTIEQRLSYKPDVETRNRKPLKRPVEFAATWELRFGSDNRFRVFYDVDIEQRKSRSSHWVLRWATGLQLRDVEFEL